MSDSDRTQFGNYMKLQFVLNTTATKCLREIFMHDWKAQTNMTWRNSPADGNFFICNQASRIYRQVQKLQKELLESGNLDRWDISLLSQAIKLFPSTNQKLSTVDRNTNLDILKEERNKLAHQGSTVITDDDFKTIWNRVSTALLRFGVPQTTLDDVLTTLIGAGEAKEASSPENADFTVAKELKEAGNSLFKDRKYYEAISKYTEAIKLPGLPYKELAALYSNRAAAFYSLDDFESAKSDAKGVILVHAAWPKGYFRLASAYEALDKLPQALKNYQLALGLDPDNEDLKNSMGRVKHSIEKRGREEHLDPLALRTTAADSVAYLKQMGIESSVHQMHNNQRMSAACGLAHGICGEGHRHALGMGRKQDYEQAAKCFAQAASMGNAEGLYNLAILTIEGKGVKTNCREAVRLLEQAASQPTMINVLGKNLRNIGKAEAEHSLGLWHHFGTGVPLDFQVAKGWYKEAIKHGMGSSCNNLAQMYNEGRGVPYNMNMAINLWKLGSYYHCPRATENLALQYLGIRDPENGWNWYDFAVSEGSTFIVLRNSDFVDIFGKKPNRPFDAKAFKMDLKTEVLMGPLKDFVCPAEEMIDSTPKLAAKMEEMQPKGVHSVATIGEYKSLIVCRHRKGLEETARQNQMGAIRTTTAGSLSSKGITDLFGLKPIFLEEMVATEDHIYEGFVIKLTIIEDAIVGRPSIPLIVQDEKGEAQRVYIYNYPQNKDIQETLGFGCKISIVNPYFRIATDGLAAIRVDDPSTIFFHSNLREKSRCRFCGKGESTLKCRKCMRCLYCSQKCLSSDAKLLGHQYVCKKRI